jgi:hypothetical protein
MTYAQIDTEGNVLNFPYRFDDRLNQEIPEDAVEVDTISNRPTVTWRQIATFTTVDNIDGSYIANFEVKERFTSDEDALKVLKDMVKVKTRQIKDKFEGSVKQLQSDYLEDEVKSWAIQRKEAIDFTNDNTIDTPLLTKIAEGRGITIEELVTKVMENVASYDDAYGVLLGQYQKSRSALNGIDFEDNTTWDLIDSVGV